jgi:hypothetical protein
VVSVTVSYGHILGFLDQILNKSDEHVIDVCLGASKRPMLMTKLNDGELH